MNTEPGIDATFEQPRDQRMAELATDIAGAAYLIWIGVKILRTARAASANEAPAPVPMRRAFLREAATAASNPKAMLIFAAFLPQFVPPETYARDFPIAATWFLGMEAVALGLYAAMGKSRA